MLKRYEMLDFIYDSLDTVKKLKFPTAKEVALLTIGIFAAVIVAGIYFVIADTIFSDGYRAFYTKMSGTEIVASTGHAVETGAEDVLTASDVENMLSGATVQLLSGAAEEVATGAAQ
jgi:hypothetical protein